MTLFRLFFFNMALDQVTVTLTWPFSRFQCLSLLCFDNVVDVDIVIHSYAWPLLVALIRISAGNFCFDQPVNRTFLHFVLSTGKKCRNLPHYKFMALDTFLLIMFVLFPINQLKNSLIKKSYSCVDGLHNHPLTK